ncbi:MAG: flippase-like domain-containing protein [Acidobacteria bacterium]|nr:flippase-like domain-containing protein [Acidobacteriota bacterium]
MKAKLRNFLSLLIGGLFVYWFAYKLNWQEVWLQVRAANWAQLGLALALFIGTYFVRVLRWQTLISPLAKTSLRALFRATVIGFSALFIMGRAGEMIVRPAALSVKEKISPSASYATVMVERVCDMVMVVVFFAVNLVFFEFTSNDVEAMQILGWIKVTGVLLLITALAGIYGLSVFARRGETALAYLERKLQGLPTAIKKGTLSLLTQISKSLSVLHDAKELTIVVSYTILLWLMVAVAHLLVVRAFGIPYKVVPFTGAVFVMGLSMLGSVVPTPGGATGPFHTASAASLSFLGVESNKAASVAIILHLVIFAPATVFGLFYVIKDGLSLEKLKRLGERQVEVVEQLNHPNQPQEQEPDAEQKDAKIAAVQR